MPRWSPARIARRRNEVLQHSRGSMRPSLIASRVGYSTRTVQRDLRALGHSRHCRVSDATVALFIVLQVLRRRRTFGVTAAVGMLRDYGIRVPQNRTRRIMRACGIQPPQKTSKRRMPWYECDLPMRVLSIDQNEYLARYRVMSLSAIDAFSRECVHFDVVSNLTGPTHTKFYADTLRATGRLPDTTTADFAAQWRGAEYIVRCKHNGQNPSWNQNVGGNQLRRAAWQQVPSFRNTPVERSHIELWQALYGLYCEFESLERRNLLHGGVRSDSLEIWCLHRAYWSKIRGAYAAFYSQRSKQPKEKSTSNPNYPNGTYTRYELYNAWQKAGHAITPAQISLWEAVGMSIWTAQSRAPRRHECDPARTAAGKVLRRQLLHYGGCPQDCEGRYLKLRAASKIVQLLGL